MRGVVLDGVRSVRVAVRPDPAIRAPTDAVVAVERAGLCGSDLHPYTGAEPAAAGVVCGHEAVGRVLAVGGAVAHVAVGQRVVVPFTVSCGTCGTCTSGLTSRCDRAQLLGWAPAGDPAAGLDGCQAEQVRVPLADGSLVALPEDVDSDAAVLLADNAPTAWHAVSQAGPVRGRSVAVVGLGAVGLLAVWAARAQGAATVWGLDPVEGRRAVAATLGAQVLHPEEAEADLQVDAVIEAAGPAAAQRLAAALTRPGGTVSVIAVQTAPALGVSPVTAYDRNLTLRFGRAPVRAVLDGLLPQVTRGDLVLPTAQVVTHRGRPLGDAPALYRAFADREPGLVKATFALT